MGRWRRPGSGGRGGWRAHPTARAGPPCRGGWGRTGAARRRDAPPGASAPRGARCRGPRGPARAARGARGPALLRSGGGAACLAQGGALGPAGPRSVRTGEARGPLRAAGRAALKRRSAEAAGGAARRGAAETRRRAGPQPAVRVAPGSSTSPTITSWVDGAGPRPQGPAGAAETQERATQPRRAGTAWQGARGPRARFRRHSPGGPRLRGAAPRLRGSGVWPPPPARGLAVAGRGARPRRGSPMRAGGPPGWPGPSP